MVNRAVKQAARILNIKQGPGAYKLPATVTRVRVAFAQNNANGHMGARKFAQQCLPRLQYHNPQLAIVVDRTKDLEKKNPKNETPVVPSVVEVFSGEAGEVTRLDVRGMHSDAIAELLKERLGAVDVSETQGTTVLA